MSQENRNVEVLRAACRRWGETHGGSVDDWMAICSDQIAFGSLAQGNPERAKYLTSYHNKTQLEDYFAGLARDWEMIEFVANQFVAQDDRVVMLGRCAWKYKKTGKVVWTPKADSWRFSDGKAVEFYEYYAAAQVHQADA
jgi:ketosteroid isomerase-like protein